MSRDQQRVADYLAHIVEAIERIARYTREMDETMFLNNQLVQDGVIRNLEIIGEASHNIEVHHPEFAVAHPELPLAFACQMRNAVAHGYFKVDLEIVWRTIHRDLPRLHARIQEVLA
ncbi:HepT-like ribonuclease domain-containing protein [Variovorax sp. DT-64]|uniref:HepT-like ribonuclease domain-containing protein n=1 Tax=Variovorax sp. DT-64 TaxID=3396160 RepID=UPI003F1DA8B6